MQNRLSQNHSQLNRNLEEALLANALFTTQNQGEQATRDML